MTGRPSRCPPVSGPVRGSMLAPTQLPPQAIPRWSEFSTPPGSETTWTGSTEPPGRSPGPGRTPRISCRRPTRACSAARACSATRTTSATSCARVVVNATNGNDSITVNGDAGGVKASGLAATVGILHSEAANDRLEINTLAGVNVVDSGGLAAGAIQLFVDGALVP
jgi:hypothetical protein